MWRRVVSPGEVGTMLGRLLRSFEKSRTSNFSLEESFRVGFKLTKKEIGEKDAVRSDVGGVEEGQRYYTIQRRVL